MKDSYKAQLKQVEEIADYFRLMGRTESIYELSVALLHTARKLEEAIDAGRHAVQQIIEAEPAPIAPPDKDDTPF